MVNFDFPKLIAVFKEAGSWWLKDSIPRLAAALSFYTAFSMAPLILLVVSLAGLVFGRDAIQGRVVEQFSGLMGPESASTLQTLLQGAYHPAKGLVASTVSIFSLLIGAFGVLSELKGALNLIWRVREPSGLKHLIGQNIRYFGMILAIGFLLMVSLLASAAMSAFGKWMGGAMPISANVLYFVNFMVSFGVTTLLFAAMYKVLPTTLIAWRDVWMGAAMTSLLFSIGKIALGFYLGRGVIGSTYGGAGSILIVLLWVYYSGFIFYLGAEFTKVYSKYYGSRMVHLSKTGSGRQPAHAAN